MSKKVKIFAIVILVLAAIIGGSVYFGGTKNAPATPLSSSASKAAGVTGTASSNASTEFSILLATIKDITIDTKIFSDPIYLSLRNYPVTLGSDIQGRPNPFAPVGYDAGPTTSGTQSVAQVQFETIQPRKVTSMTAEFGAIAYTAPTSQATVTFQYGTNDLFSNTTAAIPLASNNTALFRVSGLVPQTIYLVRAILAQGAITTVGNTMTFTTSK